MIQIRQKVRFLEIRNYEEMPLSQLLAKPARTGKAGNLLPTSSAAGRRVGLIFRGRTYLIDNSAVFNVGSACD